MPSHFLYFLFANRNRVSAGSESASMVWLYQPITMDSKCDPFGTTYKDTTTGSPSVGSP
jgi:hypothetical protein